MLYRYCTGLHALEVHTVHMDRHDVRLISFTVWVKGIPYSQSLNPQGIRQSG